MSRAVRPRGIVGVFVAALALAGGGFAPTLALESSDFTGDVKDPVVESFTLTPGQADVTLADATFHARLRITDDLSGVEHVDLIWTNPTSQSSRLVYPSLVSGDGRSGIWEASFAVPRYSPPGRYQLSVWVTDRVGNQLQDQPDSLAARGLPSGFDITDADSDITAPRVTAVRFIPSQVDVRGGPAPLQVEVDVDDAQSGAVWVFVGVSGPDGTYFNPTPNMALVSGTARSGRWRGTTTVPQYVRQGRWSATVTVRDRTDNGRRYTAEEIASLPAGFDVVSEEDLQAPTVVSASFSPIEVNVHDSDQNIRVRLHIKDNLAGVDHVHAVAHDMTGTGQSNWTTHPSMPRISGDARDGLYEAEMMVPRSSATGLRKLTIVTYDDVFNQVILSENDLVPLGGPPAILVYNVPLPPVLLGVDPGDASVVVRWEPPDERGAAITAYVVLESPGGARIEVPGDARTAVVRGLTNEQAHTFTVVAVNKAGASDPSPAVAATPRADTASPPPPTPSDPPAGGAIGSPTSGPVPAPDANPQQPASPTPGVPPVGSVATSRSGYWMLGRNGVVHAFGDAAHFGDFLTSGSPAIDLESTPNRDGYWITDATGRVSAFGAAPRLAFTAALLAGESVTSISATPTGEGYWLFTTRGRVLNVGDAPWLGDMSTVRLNGPVLDAVPTPSGRGYYMVASDGGVFTFGDARFAGSTGNIRLNAPVQSLVPDPDGAGYWLVASDGGVFTFNARFLGSTGGIRLNQPITGMVGSRSGNGYLMVAEDGGIFTFGDVAFRGSLGGSPPPWPIVAVSPI